MKSIQHAIVAIVASAAALCTFGAHADSRYSSATFELGGAVADWFLVNPNEVGHARNGDEGWGLSAVEVSGNTVAAVPEPETYAVLLAGLGVMGFMSRRRAAAG